MELAFMKFQTVGYDKQKFPHYVWDNARDDYIKTDEKKFHLWLHKWKIHLSFVKKCRWLMDFKRLDFCVHRIWQVLHF